MRGSKTEVWVQLDSMLKLPGYSEEKLSQEVYRREVESLDYALKNGRPNKNFVCSEGGCHNKDPALPVYRFEMVYTGKNNDRPYGIRRVLWGMCRKCIRHMLDVWEKAKQETERNDEEKQPVR